MAHRLQRLRDFIFQKVEVEFESDFPLAESVARLEKDTWRSVFASFSQEFVAGRVQADDVRLQAVQPFFGNSFKPTFRGRFVELNGEVRLRGVYEVQAATRVFMTLWLGFAVFMVVFGSFLTVFLAAVFGADIWTNLVFPLAASAFVAFGVGFLRFGWWYSSDDIVVVNTVIKRALTPQRAAYAHEQSGPR